jgi:hypothetical protein
MLIFYITLKCTKLWCAVMKMVCELNCHLVNLLFSISYVVIDHLHVSWVKLIVYPLHVATLCIFLKTLYINLSYQPLNFVAGHYWLLL